MKAILGIPYKNLFSLLPSLITQKPGTKRPKHLKLSPLPKIIPPRQLIIKRLTGQEILKFIWWVIIDVD